MSVLQSADGVPVRLTDQERAVLCCAIRYALENDVSVNGVEKSEVASTLRRHHSSATDESVIAVQPGMDELYQQVFSEYAREIKLTVPQEDFGETDATFFKRAFDGVVEKIDHNTTVGV